MQQRYYAVFFNRLIGDYDTLEFTTDEDPYSYFWGVFGSTSSELTAVEIYHLTPVRKVH